MPSPAGHLTEMDKKRVEKLIKFVGLDKPSPKEGNVAYKSASDMRVEKRMETAKIAREYKEIYKNLHDTAKPLFHTALKTIVKGTGLWSIWMHEMEDIPELKGILLNLLPGTRLEYFR